MVPRRGLVDFLLGSDNHHLVAGHVPGPDSLEQGDDRATLLSDQYTSKAFLPSRGVECEDFRTCELPAPVRGQR